METAYWIAIAVIFYTYIGYGILLYLLSFPALWWQRKKKIISGGTAPALTVIVTAYNEAGCIEEKIKNTLSLNYPQNLLQFLFVTDGSDDGTAEIVAGYPQIKQLHKTDRDGKIAAIQRAMQEVNTEIVVFTDANTILNNDALIHISAQYQNKTTGAVAGEKRVDIINIGDATSGEGFYWRYESFLKKAESGMYSVVGAAGELFSIRTALYEPIPDDTILDDLMISMKIAIKGYRVKYEPLAYATEKTSVSVTEERKRKVRIAAGGIQALVRLPFLLIPFPQPVLWFEYISHRVLRWIVTPYLLVMVYVLNLGIVYEGTENKWLIILLLLQSVFYTMAFAGHLIRKRKIKLRLFFIPYYFCLMNYSMIKGLVRYIFSGQSVNWEKLQRR